MKAKTMLGMIACASACVSLSAYANHTNSWFGVTASSGSISTNNCVASGATDIEDDIIKLDNDEDSPFVVSSFAAAPASDNIVKITASASLTPSSTNDFGNVGEAKAGFAVGIDNESTTNFYGYANGSWHKLTGATVSGSDTTFSLLLNYRDGEVSFYVGDTILNEGGQTKFDLAESKSTLVSINAYGNGTITSIEGGYEVAVAQYGDDKYGSIAEAVAAAGENKSDVQYVDQQTGTVAGKGAKAENGLDLLVCQALGIATNDADANIAVAPVETDDDEDEITLAVNVAAAPESGAVQYKVEGGSEPKYYDAASVKIPLTAGTYTITPVLK